MTIWGWQLVTFYMGFVTGPRGHGVPAGGYGLASICRGDPREPLSRTRRAGGRRGPVRLTWGQPNQIGAWTYAVLWWMHQSAKLNVFFGVPNLGEEMLPDHLAYLVTFMRRRPMNLFFPFSVTGSTIVTVLLAQKALAPYGDAVRYDRPDHADDADDAGDRRTLVPGRSVARQRALELERQGRASISALPADVAALPVAPIVRTSRVADDSDYAMPPTNASWNPGARTLPRSAIPAGCTTCWNRLARAPIGEVDCVRGVVKTNANWISFELAGRNASISPYSPQRLQEPLVIAMGRRFDRVRLQAAFDGCAAPT